jgi:hypothetical protein
VQPKAREIIGKEKRGYRFSRKGRKVNYAKGAKGFATSQSSLLLLLCQRFFVTSQSKSSATSLSNVFCCFQRSSAASLLKSFCYYSLNLSLERKIHIALKYVPAPFRAFREMTICIMTKFTFLRCSEKDIKVFVMII